MIVGYARVSTDGQTLDAQEAQLKAYGAERIYAEKVSGAVTERKALGKAITGLREGDTLLVCRSMILARTSEGRARAQARGQRFGRRPKLSPYQVQEALVRRAAGEALADIGRSYGVSDSTISRL
jgi:DNA invertase Pin-like site-specific DNA recombinase